MILRQDIPGGYLYCLSGDRCPKAGTCLHAIAARLQAENRDEPLQTLHMVSPYYLDSLPSPDNCPFYRSNALQQYARGMTRLFDDVPLRLSYLVRHRVMNCFSCERYFYHSRKGDRLITPAEQSGIAEVFRHSGISTPPKFDSYVDVVVW